MEQIHNGKLQVKLVKAKPFINRTAGVRDPPEAAFFNSTQFGKGLSFLAMAHLCKTLVPLQGTSFFV